ncbi:pyruvate dehydrogenase complex dihydrolipoamide acetyltransferase [Mesonia sp. K7]|uniref:pyruvate dehydrogenase complex dihydrolipoamide acetyltransferase n=1 Tax=Mesonia sp. K7 TaxID=2218606 RepID=UPI000DA9E08C|nr:pyruvate dehydrogenase complex dihydrolipoamide acetyltransferase [Mesonia sp. K7]PZD77162.1 pyruvate dehydrogenase complex dihydrolipoamide acetyltransferase [Mesonia sp. K7]
MAEVINMPRLSDTMEEGTVATWLKKVGDQVEEGDILAEIETDKATMEFESFHSGTLLHIGIEEGQTAPVDALLAIIGEEGEDVSDLIEGKSKSKKSEKEEKSSKKESSDKDDTSTEEEGDTSEEIPEGVEVINMPRLSDTMEEGTVASWLKSVGDEVEEGDILAEIETDKATMEFESFYAGTLLHIGVQEGETTKVDALLAIIGPEGTDVSAIIKGSGKTKAKKKPSDEDAEEKPEEAKSKDTSSTEKKSTRKDGGRIFASPLAKKMAEEKGIDLSEVEGSGDNGRIIKKDIENFKPSAKAEQKSTTAKEASQPSSSYTPVGEEAFEEVNNSQVRKTIAKRLSESKFSAPHYYLTIELDMDNLIETRKQINAQMGIKVSFNDFIVKASAMALRKHPAVNSQWADDKIKFAKHIHMGVAVATDYGLVVPVLKFADQMPLSVINAKVKEMAGKARDKKLGVDEMQGSTFTVSNLGAFGIQEFTSIINQPNSAILSIGAIVEKPVVKNGQVVVGNTMKVTMACDHRTVDGATGAEYLQTFKTYLENPVSMLV